MAIRTINGVTLALLKGNIVEVRADAIVNAANSGLRGGGGVDGAIHRAGGPTIMEACRKIGDCPTGSAVATSAGKLQARYVFHAVGPIYSGTNEDAQLLASAHQSCLDLAERHRIKSIAFPALSAGVYGYPLDEAAPIALRTIIQHVQKPTNLQEVIVVLFGDEAFQAFERALKEIDRC